MSLQRTAFEACSRKVHCVAKRYLDDPFVGFFARDSTIVNSPLMNRGTWLRTKAIEHSVLSFAASADVAGQPIQIISFGAGVDTLYFRLAKSHPELKLAAYVELDLPDLVEDKKRIIARRPQLRDLLRPEYSIHGVDLRQTSECVQLLQQLVRPGVPTMLLAEMVFVYLDEAVSTQLLHHVLYDVLGGPSTLCQLVTYDAIEPYDRFGEMMVSSLAARGVELRGIHSLATAEAHKRRCQDIGFASVECNTMRQLYLTVPHDTQVWLGKLEMIDDWDEWNLVHDHYCFLVARTKNEPAQCAFTTTELRTCP